MTVLFYLAISARSSNSPWPVHARAHQRTRPSTPRSSRPRLLSQPSCPRPSRARQRTPAPRPQPGPGPGFQPSSIARLGQKRPEPSWPLISDRRWSAQLGASKTPADRASLSPSFIFTRTLSLSSPHCSPLLFSVRHRATTVKQRGPGVVAGPLAGMCAPQRVSAPPSSGLAAAPL